MNEDVGLFVCEAREEEEVFLSGRELKAFERKGGGEVGETVGSGEASIAFCLFPDTCVMGPATFLRLGPVTFDFRVPFNGVPILGKTHFFLFRMQD